MHPSTGSKTPAPHPFILGLTGPSSHTHQQPPGHDLQQVHCDATHQQRREARFHSTDRDTFHMFTPSRNTVPRQVRTQHEILHVQPGRSPDLSRRHPIPAVPEEHSRCIAMGSAAHVEAEECGWMPPTAPRWARRYGMKQPESQTPRVTFHPHPDPLAHVSSVPSGALQAGPVPAASRLRQQSMSRPALLQSTGPRSQNGNLSVIGAIRAWGAGSRPRPGRPKVLARPSSRSGPAHQRMPVLLLRVHSRRVHDPSPRAPRANVSVPSPSGHHDPTTPRRLPLSLPNRHVLVGWERAPRGPAGQVVTIQSSFPFSTPPRVSDGKRLG
ncbi:hypothetical protein B0T18DRAFT_54898 [Schizothecium vesticola]|uniref:Uncharacterized protein n=1 Tax=Schizothecium vesticola TaxID=314040 RepID=A0AA40F432_9PEZI|nr:hypothetical protein B0T18DRAFT_54898 [Schizothecium vesticola]